MEPLALHDIHARLGAHFGTAGGREVVTAYASLAAEHAALLEAAGVIDQSFRELLRFTGPDRADFLHGMLTADVKGLAENRTRYAAQLTSKGAMIADARLWRLPDQLLADLEPGVGERVKEVLERYLISEDVELERVGGESGLLTVLGPLAAEVVRAALGVEPPPPERVVEFEAAGARGFITGLAAPWPTGFDLLVPGAALGAVFERLLAVGGEAGLRPVGFEALEVLRVERGIPRYGLDMDERTLPMEARLERAISYEKGCYIGQEVIARATYRGRINRKLIRLAFSGQPAARAELYAGDKKVGMVTSVVRRPADGVWLGLGYVHRDHLAAGTQLGGEGFTARIEPLPYASGPDGDGAGS